MYDGKNCFKSDYSPNNPEATIESLTTAIRLAMQFENSHSLKAKEFIRKAIVERSKEYDWNYPNGPVDSYIRIYKKLAE